MPVGPLALMDEVSLELMHKVMRQTEADLGAAYKAQPQDPVLIRMVEELKRLGRKSGGGFYDYAADGSKRLWPELATHFPRIKDQPSVEEVQKRLMYIQSIEASRAMAENIVGARDADVGSILGWGFPAALGGVVSQVDTIGRSRASSPNATAWPNFTAAASCRHPICAPAPPAGNCCGRPDAPCLRSIIERQPRRLQTNAIE